MTALTVYCTGHRVSKVICAAMAYGVECDIAPSKPGLRDDGNPAFFYGMLRHNWRLRKQCIRTGRDWYLADNGYMRPGQFQGYYRITRNALLCDGHSPPCTARLDALGVRPRPWRQNGRYVLLCVPYTEYCGYWGFNGREWQKTQMAKLREATDRPIVLSYKPGDPRMPADQPPIESQLAGAWAVVAHDSNIAVDAIIAGVPVFVTGETPARLMGRADAADIEQPLYPDNRREWLATLAANQWTLDEFMSGRAWEDLKDIYSNGSREAG